MTRWVAFVSVGVGARQRTPLSVLVRSPHKGLERKISQETGRGQEKETVGSRQKSREGQSRDESREER